MMSSRIDTFGKQLESVQQYGRTNSLRFHNVPMKLDNIQDTAGLVLKVSRVLIIVFEDNFFFCENSSISRSKGIDESTSPVLI
jgi:hypothetical protein